MILLLNSEFFCKNFIFANSVNVKHIFTTSKMPDKGVIYLYQ